MICCNAITWGVAFAAFVLGAPLAAQSASFDPNTGQSIQPKDQNDGLRDTGRTASTGLGEVGQRQTQRGTPKFVSPLGRISSRIENRVQNRIRNRIDRSYDPTGNATAPFERAERRAQTVNQRARAGPR
jgi:hypothetical protein